MSVELIVELAWKSFVVAGLTLLVLELMKRRSAAERSWIAHAGLIAMLLLPVTVVAGPNWEVQALPSVASIAPAEAAGLAPAPVRTTGNEALPIPEATAGPIAVAPALPAEQMLPWLLYVVPAALLALLLIVAVLRLHLLRSRSEVLVEPQWATALASAQRRMGFKHGTALLVSEELRSPISWGVVRPIILLDRRAAADTEQAEAIIAHELAHVARLDWAMLLLGRLATAIYWFNPLVWILARYSHELSEQAVDDAVLRHDINNADYARLLIGTARHDNAAVLLAANGVAGSGTLTHRVERVLDASRSSSPARWSWIVACCAGTVLIAAPLSALSPIRAIPAPTSFAGYPIEQAGLQPIADRIGARGEAVRPSPTGVLGLAEQAAGSNERAGAAAADDGAPSSGASLAGIHTLDSSSLKALESLNSLESLKSLETLKSLASLDAAGRNVTVRGQSVVRGNAPIIRDARPLLVAAWYGRLDMVKTLLDAGADINATTGRGEGNALMKASRQGNLELVKYLLDRGANINAAVPGAGNALLQASHGGHEDVVRYLIARGANVGSINKDESPLESAVYMGHTNIVKILIAAGAGRESH